VILVTIYVFSPYFSRVLVGDPVRGQATVADISTMFGLITAFTAPLLGASIERYGPRKPLMALIIAIMVPLLFALWLAKPGGMPVDIVGMVLIVLGVAYNWGDVTNNSLLARASEPGQEPVLSGLGYAVANGLSVSLLIFVMWAFVLPGVVPWSFVPATPLFGLSQAEHEPSRLVGPLSGAVMLLGAIPFFLWTRDAPRTGHSILASLKEGVRLIVDTFANLKGHADVAKFLGARMLYCDGMTALIIFGGLFAAGLMKWGELEMLAYGISLSIFGVIGGLIAPWLDRKLGPRRAVQVEIAGCILMLMGTLGHGPREDPVLLDLGRGDPSGGLELPAVPHPAGADLSGHGPVHRRVRHGAIRLEPHPAGAPGPAGPDGGVLRPVLAVGHRDHVAGLAAGGPGDQDLPEPGRGLPADRGAAGPGAGRAVHGEGRGEGSLRERSSSTPTTAPCRTCGGAGSRCG
jgi:MFS family permease